jgi:hypothetical protein
LFHNFHYANLQGQVDSCYFTKGNRKYQIIWGKFKK